MNQDKKLEETVKKENYSVKEYLRGFALDFKNVVNIYISEKNMKRLENYIINYS